MNLEGKVVLVTGASGGLGTALSKAFADARCRVAVSGRNRVALEALVGELRAAHAVADAFVHDLREVDGAAALVGEVERRLGPLAVLVNNAGTGASGMVCDIPGVEFRTAMECNLLGAIALTQAALPGMSALGAGSIVFVSSGVALRALPGFAPYCAAKAALSAFAESLRAELYGTGVGVLTVYPGKLNTEFDRRARHFGPPFDLSVGGGATPARIAARVVQAVQNDRAEVMVRGPAWVAAWLNCFAPRLVDRILARRLALIRRAGRTRIHN